MGELGSIFRVNAVRDWTCRGWAVVYRPEYSYRVTVENREQVSKWVLSGIAEYLNTPAARIQAKGHVGT